MVNFRAHYRLAILFLVGFVFTICCSCQSAAKHAGAPEKITIGCGNSPISALVQIAFTNGYFAEEGLDATPQKRDSGKEALQLVTEGKADLATVATTPIMFSILGGQETMILAVIHSTSKNVAILVRRDHGIVKPEDLKGKKIGFVRGALGDYYADVFLRAHGIKRTEIKVVDLKPSEMAAALHSGTVDAVSIWNPLFIQRQLEESGDKGQLFYDESLFTYIACLAARKDYIKQHPETIKKVLRALIKAENFARQRPEEARRLAAEFFPLLDRSNLEVLWKDLFLRVTLDQPLIMDLEEQSKWAINNGLTKRRDIPNYLNFIYFDGLRAVRPESIRITR
jgi:sulfonate transport system substrate-binding protein